jgi:hypothetical protein
VGVAGTRRAVGSAAEHEGDDACPGRGIEGRRVRTKKRLDPTNGGEQTATVGDADERALTVGCQYVGMEESMSSA